RPIIMTALAFIFGCLPLWTASGSGAASRRILGTVVIGGMTVASVLGILMVPVTFAVVEYLSHRFTSGGKDLTMDSPHVSGDDDRGLTPEPQGGHA
ncbi:MAG TPA: efflux RND transporter permease subunit, partial [Candidatus Sulfotelmatobacter sp.]